ncbi:MAG: ATP-grasp domain-containing protein [Deltaproteobacteria bacterium]|jgi:acetyl/propionyl-CoA carboxylase alpha subunit/acetyl-CoA carboxylase carboxyltransferase component|nr:ATP-grasp domain-containing protein [Deltaproteobacteria bacterium]
MQSRYLKISKTIRRLLIANRGEPAMRAIRTCRKLGIESAVIYYGDDAASDWVSSADFAYRLFKPEEVEESPYLDGEQIIQVALDNECQAVWPGWGFLSEESSFARETNAAGLIWVGPSDYAMSLLGSKSESSSLARECGFETIPEIMLKDGETLSSEIDMSYPAVIKPALGGGGKGQVIVQSEDELRSKVDEVARQARTLYGSGELVIQKYLEGARHIELQIISDGKGSSCILGSRDCSIQRRNQKIIEEAPPISLSEALLKTASKAAKLLFEKSMYSSAGTVEMLLYGEHLYFLEVNTRLQVEHTVTEESIRVSDDQGMAKLDILAEMLNIASGEKLSFSEDDIKSHGYSIEARIYAEDPEEGFVPTPGRVCFVRFPEGEGIRVDTAFVGPEVMVSKYFDPMLAKVVASGKTREEAIGRLIDSLGRTVILGIKTNIDFLRRIASHPDFSKGAYHTGFLSEAGESLSPSKDRIYMACSIAASIAYMRANAESYRGIGDSRIVNLEDALGRLPENRIDYQVTAMNDDYVCEVGEWNEGQFAVKSGDSWLFLNIDTLSPYVYTVRDSKGKSHETFLYATNGKCQMVLDGEYYHLNVVKEGAGQDRRDPHAAPYGGRIIKICVNENDHVEPDDELYILEAMKMESRVRSISSGVVKGVLLSDGDAVEVGETVLLVDSDEVVGSERVARKILDLHSQDDLRNDLFSKPHSLMEGDNDIHIAWSKHSTFIRQIPELYFKGYDIAADTASVAFDMVSKRDAKASINILSRVAKYLIAAIRLRDEDVADDLLNFIKYPKKQSAEASVPSVFKDAFEYFGVTSINSRDELSKVLPRMLRWIRNTDPKHLHVMVSMIEKHSLKGAGSSELVATIIGLVQSGIFDLEGELKSKLLGFLRLIDVNEYYKIIKPPVSLDYLDEYEMHRSRPLSNLSEAELLRMRECAQHGERLYYKDDFSSLPQWLSVLFDRWYEGFYMKEMAVGDGTSSAGVQLFELRNKQNSGDKRLLAIAIVDTENGHEKDGKLFLPNLERAGIEAYRSIAQYVALGAKYPFNHVFVITPSDLVLPWKASGSESGSFSPIKISDISSRIAGFARNINVSATEVILNLERQGKVLSHILEIRHADPVGVINRPPYPIAERVPELMKGMKGQLDDKQHRLGKLLNEDRARVLFDDGEYDEVFFPEVDLENQSPVGLRVFKGKISGAMSIAYAGDFRIKGGALGEREGKKLAASVVLAYVSNVPLVGIHDGAGADIRGSVASLGWAGAYFGAIANTGGFSSVERFWEWFNGHHGRDYFEMVLESQGFKPNDDGRWVARSLSGYKRMGSKFVHLHLNLGATVGMLVYGAAISSMSLMVNKPQAYRVLTGAGTVKKVTGESISNYDLGGAKVHSMHSGDIDVEFDSEEEVLECARKLIISFSHCNRAKHTVAIEPDHSADPSVDSNKVVKGFDCDSFLETKADLKGASKLLTGFGSLGGRVVGISASMSNYGLRNSSTLKKLYASYSGCQEFDVPLILIVRDKWYGIPEGATSDVMHARAECDKLFPQLTVPRISIAIGPRSLDVGVHQIADICCYIADGTESDYDINRANVMAHMQYKNISECLDGISKLISYLSRDVSDVEVSSGYPELKLPQNYAQAYDIRDFIQRLVDRESFLEFHSNDDLPLIVGFALMAGNAVAIISDNPNVNAGAQTAHALGKFTRFNRICERFSIPIVELNDSPAFQPGSKQERLGIQGEGGRSLREECLGSVPKMAVTLRQNYGGRYIHANLKTLGPNREGLVCEGARVGVMGAEGAVGILYGKKLNALDPSERDAARQKFLTEYVEKSLNPETAVKLGYAKKLVSLDNLRVELHEWIKSI